MPFDLNNPAILEAAIAGLEMQKRQIDVHLATLRAAIGEPPKRRGRPPGSGKQMGAPEATTAAPSSAPLKRPRKMSPEARKRIGDATRARHAAARLAAQSAGVPTAAAGEAAPAPVKRRGPSKKRK